LSGTYPEAGRWRSPFCVKNITSLNTTGGGESGRVTEDPLTVELTVLEGLIISESASTVKWTADSLTMSRARASDFS
jgi:hypothetical protein